MLSRAVLKPFRTYLKSQDSHGEVLKEGKVISKEGNLDANTLDISLVWRFGTPN